MLKIIKSGWLNQFKAILSHYDLDQELWNELEELLIISDVGIHSTQMILDNFKSALRFNENNSSIEHIIDLLK